MRSRSDTIGGKREGAILKKLCGLIGLVMLALLVGCNAAPPAATNGPDCLAQAPKPPAGATRATVSRVVDGDTVDLADGTKVRLVGINTPESVDPHRPVQPFGKEASAYTKSLLQGKQVLVQPGRTPRDKYGRLLAWIWTEDGRLVNALLVRDGYAQTYTFSDNPDHADLIRACEQEARSANRGLWALPAYHDGQRAAEMDRGGADGQSETTPPVTGGVTITDQPGSVARGEKATVSVTTTPGATCNITVEYKSGAASADGLEARTADAGGVVRWSWVVGSKTATGTWPVRITCGGESGATTITVR